jgi:tRNA (guanine37-N1)-methyltransferase
LLEPTSFLKPEPFFRGVEHIRETRGKAITILMAPDGRIFDSDSAKDLSKRERIIILSGRYEGIDHRVRKHLVDEVWSVGPYVTPGGDIPSLALISSVIRQIPGVVGNQTSVEQDSFQENRLAPPHYTRPRTYRGHAVPEILLSGDHKRIEEWRERQALKRTRQNRPELLNEDDSDQNDTQIQNEKNN